MSRENNTMREHFNTFITDLKGINKYKNFSPLELKKMFDAFFAGFKTAIEINNNNDCENQLFGTLHVDGITESNKDQWEDYNDKLEEIKAIVKLDYKTNRTSYNYNDSIGISIGSATKDIKLSLLDTIVYLFTKMDEIDTSLGMVVNHLNLRNSVLKEGDKGVKQNNKV